MHIAPTYNVPNQHKESAKCEKYLKLWIKYYTSEITQYACIVWVDRIQQYSMLLLCSRYLHVISIYLYIVRFVSLNEIFRDEQFGMCMHWMRFCSLIFDRVLGRVRSVGSWCVTAQIQKMPSLWKFHHGLSLLFACRCLLRCTWIPEYALFGYLRITSLTH